jgi:hypothetical protein
MVRSAEPGLVSFIEHRGLGVREIKRSRLAAQRRPGSG